MRFILLVALLLIASRPLQAQQANPLSLSIGDQISLREPLAGGTVLRGTVSKVDPDALTYMVDGDYRLYFRPYVGIDTIAVKRRMPRASARAGALWGAFLGGAAGIIAAPFYAKTSSMATGTAVVVIGAGGGLGGGLLGAAAGAVLFPRIWFRHVLP